MRTALRRLLAVIIFVLIGPKDCRHFSVQRSKDRHEVSVLIRRPIYVCWRIGRTQNALWVGFIRAVNVYNWFPTPWSTSSVTLGRWSRRGIQHQLRQINQRHDLEDHPEKLPLYLADPTVKLGHAFEAKTRERFAALQQSAAPTGVID